MAEPVRNIEFTLTACIAVLEGRGINCAELNQIREKACYTAPEDQYRHWLALCRCLGGMAASGVLPSPKAENAPAWVKFVSDVVEGRIWLVAKEQVRS